jgi:hypothetical protein
MAQTTPVPIDRTPTAVDAQRLRERATYASLVVAAMLIVAHCGAWIGSGGVGGGGGRGV